MDDWRKSAGTRSPAADIEILDGVSNSLCRIADAAEFIRNVHSDPDWIQGATDAVQAVSGFMNEANVSSDLYDRARGILERGKAANSLDKEYSHVISAMVQAMEHEGVGLGTQEKARLVELQEQDVVKSFNVVQSRGNDDKRGGAWVEIGVGQKKLDWTRMLPSRTNNSGRSEFYIPSGNASVVPHLLKTIDCRSTRQQVWEAGNVVNDATRRKEEALHELVQIRTELAQIRGYKNWNAYAQRESVMTPIGGPAAVERFLGDLWVDMGPGLARELDVLKDLNADKKVEPWDLDYLIQSWKDHNPKAIESIQAIQSHLTFQKIIAGGQRILSKVLDVDLQHDAQAGRMWHEDAFRLSLSRDGQKPFAYLYVDPYERESKSVQSAQFTLAGSKRMPDGSRQTPQTALVLALPRDPTIPLPLSVAQTFFHELGHATHSLLSETNLQHFSGSRGAIDFVEFPSHLFEYFATEPECLREIIGSSLHESYLDDYSKNRNPFAHIEVAQQLTYAMLDQVYYATGSPTELAQHLPLSPVVDIAHVLSLLQPNSTANFEHLVHYGGSYYCYLLCRALAADVWKQSFCDDPWNRDAGSRLGAFLRSGSVDQSLDAIDSILPGRPSGVGITTVALLADLRRCSTIHK